MDNNPIIEVVGVTHTIGGVTALQELSLSIGRGEFVALMGPNGSGKSTLVKHFNALLLPTAGQVRVEGMDTADPRQLWKIRETVGMVFQNPDHQMVSPVVEEELAFGPENLGVPPPVIRQRVDRALEMLELASLRFCNPAHLSGGQKQRVAIASILAMRPTIMVLDEPTAMLDARGREETMQAILQLRRETELTVVLVTHSWEEALQADRAVILDRGRVVADGVVAAVLTNLDGSLEPFFELPPTVRLSRLLASQGLILQDEFPTNADALADAIAHRLNGAA